jgi:hypothetical protein
MAGHFDRIPAVAPFSSHEYRSVKNMPMPARTGPNPEQTTFPVFLPAPTRED